jgi:hypothetical protein
MHLFTLRRNFINFIDEDNSWGILLSLLENLSQITLTLSCHLAQNFGTVDQGEERSRFVRDCASHEHLTSTAWTEQEDTMRGLDTDPLWITVS